MRTGALGAASDRMAENEREAEEKMSDKEEIVFVKAGAARQNWARESWQEFWKRYQRRGTKT